jgi:hypothetical protein
MKNLFYRNTRIEKHFGGGGNPHGQSVGLMKCMSKVDIGDDKTSLIFYGVDSLIGSTGITVSKEVAEYFSVDTVYEVRFTTP